MERCFCPCHRHPGAVLQPCWMCGHLDRDGGFPSHPDNGWEMHVRLRDAQAALKPGEGSRLSSRTISTIEKVRDRGLGEPEAAV